MFFIILLALMLYGHKIKVKKTEFSVFYFFVCLVLHADSICGYIMHMWFFRVCQQVMDPDIEQATLSFEIKQL
jgi:hypothetical protein